MRGNSNLKSYLEARCECECECECECGVSEFLALPAPKTRYQRPETDSRFQLWTTNAIPQNIFLFHHHVVVVVVVVLIVVMLLLSSYLLNESNAKLMRVANAISIAPCLSLSSILTGPKKLASLTTNFKWNSTWN